MQESDTSYTIRLAKSRLRIPTNMEEPFNISSFKHVENIYNLQRIAQSDGLESNFILKLVAAIGSRKLNSSKKLKLVKCIIPRYSIPEDALLRMALYLNDFKLELELKVEILKWIIAALPLSENYPNLSKFHCIYDTYLVLLKEEALRPYLIYLLISVSTKNLLTVDNLQYIAVLQYEYNLPCFNFLLSKLSKLYPKIADRNFLDLQLSSNKDDLSDIYPDLETEMAAYKSSLHILSRNTVSEENLSVPRNAVSEENLSVPSFHLDLEETISDKVSSVSEFGAFEEIYKNILHLKESPLKDIFSSHSRRLLFTSDIGLNAQASFFDYILTSFWVSSCDFGSTLPVILEVLHEIQEPIIEISDFMSSIIDKWNGHSNFHTVLEIFSYHEIGCFEGKVAYTLDSLLEKIQSVDVIHKCQFLHCLTTIYQKWALFELPVCEFLICKENCSQPQDNITPFGAQQIHLPADETYKFGSYIDTVCEQFVSSDDFRPCLLNQVLLHYQKVSSTHLEVDDLIVHLPTPTIFISSLFSLNSFTLEVLCQLVLRLYREVYSETKANHPEIELARHHFKSCLFDLGNVLWILRNYKSTDHTYMSRTAVYKKLSKHFPSFIEKFALYMHPALMLNITRFCTKYSMMPFLIRHLPQVELFFTELSEDGLKSCADITNFFHAQSYRQK